MKVYPGIDGWYAVIYNGSGKLAYQVTSLDVSNSDWIQVDLELVAGWDYVNPDENDIQGWCPPENFIEDVQYDYVLCYIFDEGIKEALRANDYNIVPADEIRINR